MHELTAPHGGLVRRASSLVVLLVLLALPTAAHASRSPLDPEFGRGGVVITPAPLELWNGTVCGLSLIHI